MDCRLLGVLVLDWSVDNYHYAILQRSVVHDSHEVSGAKRAVPW